MQSSLGTNLLYFIYGLCVMFYAMMTWFFLRKNREVLSRLVALLTAAITVECLKDLFFIYDSYRISDATWQLLTASDMVVVPLYVFILMELLTPGRLTPGRMVLHELPFVALPLLLVLTGSEAFYVANVAWTALYGAYYAVWTLVMIPRYHNIIKENFSYQENINLGWLRAILLCFVVILALWTVDCFSYQVELENIYMLGSLVIWAFISYFLYRHESVISELTAAEEPAKTLAQAPVEATDEAIEPTTTEEISDSQLGAAIRALFVERQLYLNPKLKLSDVAKLVGTNRTYLSNHFNHELGVTFYDYINGLRLDHAERLLTSNNETLQSISESSGFNSLSTFRRAFEQRHNCSPAEYRQKHTGD